MTMRKQRFSKQGTFPTHSTETKTWPNWRERAKEPESKVVQDQGVFTKWLELESKVGGDS